MEECNLYSDDDDVVFVASPYSGPRIQLVEDPDPEEVPFAGSLDEDGVHVFYQSKGDKDEVAEYMRDVLDGRDDEFLVPEFLRDKLGECGPDEIEYHQDRDEVKKIFEGLYGDEELDLGTFGSKELGVPKGPESLRR
ncbi:MAG: hypothetical protein ABEJ93_04955 [Candidatus Nanohalobium sp.]